MFKKEKKLKNVSFCTLKIKNVNKLVKILSD